jgi:hypothetical protein
MKTTRKHRNKAAREARSRPQSSGKPEIFEPAQFLNIDVDVRSRRSLSALASAWPWAQDPYGNSRWLYYSGHGRGRTAEATANELVKQVIALPSLARRSWDLASKRTFDIGVQGGVGPRAFEKVQRSPETLARISSIGARIKLTVYPPQRG